MTMQAIIEQAGRAREELTKLRQMAMRLPHEYDQNTRGLDSAFKLYQTTREAEAAIVDLMEPTHWPMLIGPRSVPNRSETPAPETTDAR